MNEDKLLIKIAEMYYQEDKNQSQIAKELNIHRSTISRLLKKSREEGIVQVTINYDKDEAYELEKKLQEKFGLERASVVQVSSEVAEEQRLSMVAVTADEYLTSILEDQQMIGFSWGGTLSAFATNMSPKNYKDILCIPLIGGPAGRLISDYHVNTITYEAAKKLNGRALLIDAPAFPESKEVKEALMNNPFNQELIEHWKKVDIAIFGIGSPHLSGRRAWTDFYGDDMLNQLTQQEVVGDVISKFYNSQGEHVLSDLDERIIGASLEDLLQIKIRIGIAESKDKALAILGALRGRYVNVLVTTAETAREILMLDEKQTI
ncbi:DNA-binding transcriptional regulator LsrR (DeoR family) [Enterococcus sp. PF1-24]|uniref:sugar-binding transcriptional regulator n=1 Tax=unclassified Enterococcus TaxID=2608891 RepID=UPI00247512CC|nr:MULTISPECIES: sugar-binding transcriptional regulator [unclassified Enterococcus]MDH6364908.1 DNA-binding transcriptional regulator LsrR (DeoR family) [Enterococcus sp. PFB1-1]MDH6402009.1 DNA-binding transcriptional regulator LsrR (DeoR family) [Enterococcus sp. PF1-24]